jgi:hypothetical protein
MPWKKLLAWATGQIDEALRQKLEFALEERADASLPELRAALLVSVALRGASGWKFAWKLLEMRG